MATKNTNKIETKETNKKSFFDLLKLNESTISMALGFLVLIAIGFLVVNYIQTRKDADDNANNPSTTQTAESHVVNKGESLWSIAEQYYNDGFRWKEIAEANKITNGSIEVGQTLTIPNTKETVTASPTPGATESASPIATASNILATTAPAVTTEPTPGMTPTSAPEATPSETNQIPESYTVVKGDSLWKISEKIYGNGYKWVEIARANKLIHPGIIHTGNTLTLPR
jgi:nucleoid-associated protein YgaU